MVRVIKIDLGGKNRPVRVNHRAIADFCAEYKVSYKDFVSLGTFIRHDQFVFLLWLGLREGAAYESLKFDSTLDDVYRWLDDADFGKIMDAMFSGIAAPMESKKK